MRKRLILAWLICLFALFQWLPDTPLRGDPQQVFPILGQNFSASGPPPTTVTYRTYCQGSTGCTWITTVPSANDFVIIDTWGAVGQTPTINGTSTWEGPFELANGTSYSDYVWYTCKWLDGSLDLTIAGGTFNYTTGLSAGGNTTSGATACNDGTGPKNGTPATTAVGTLTSANITTTNAASLTIGIFSNGCGAETYTAGADGQGHTMTLRAQDGNGVLMMQTYTEAAAAVYAATATWTPNCRSNARIFAVK